MASALFDPYNRVWEYSQQRGSKKLLMLAFAKHADALGVCWPSIETLAKLIGEPDQKYVRRLVGELVNSGELYKRAGGGRGIATVYGVLVGLTPEQAARLRSTVDQIKIKNGLRIIENSGAESTVSAAQEAPNSGRENTVPESTFSLNSGAESTLLPPNSGRENTVPESTLSLNSGLQSPKTVDSSFRPEAPNPAAESHKQAQKASDNYHGTIGGGGVRTPPPPIEQPRVRAGSRATSQPAHVKYLADAGMGAAHLFADCDPEAAIADFDARIADRWTIPAIVNFWKQNPPKPGATYERPDYEANQPERSAQPARTASRRPTAGDIDYYTRSRK